MSPTAIEIIGIDAPDDVLTLRDLLAYIADEMDREMDELRELVNPGGQPIGEAVREIATGEDKYPWGDSKYPLLKEALDRYYLPRPLFEDGEPVQFGDRFVRDFGRDAKIDSLSYTKGNSDYVNINGYERHDFAHRLKRPNPQVLDADGVQIEVGDVLYRTTDDMKAVVAKLEKGYFVDDEGAGFNPSYFTHREPDTQERIEEDATMPPRAYYAKHIGYDVGLKDDEEVWTAVMAHLLRRQRELDGRDA